jgi:predicted O-linked N-acetylglucosamine transferase (SPINDLY family)
MDYRLTDAAFDPPDAAMSPYAEKPLRLRSYWCYPAPENAPPVSPLPARAAGHITLACLNNFAKVSPQALATWMDILRQLPESRLFLHASPGTHQGRLRATLAAANIDPARCEFFGFLPFADYLALHHRIDLALDPFPYAGGTTSCDALYMGVPLVTWAGPTALSRGGASILSAVGLPELIATTPHAYAEIAVSLAQDLRRLAQLRASLRGRLEASALMDARGFAGDFQAKLRAAWRAWARQ